MYKVYFFAFLFLFGFNVAFSQNLYLKDIYSNEPVSFGKIYPENDKPFLSDIDGKFHVTNVNQRIAVKAISYRDTILSLIIDDSVIFLTPSM